MLAPRIIPSLLCRGRTLVKGVAFDSWRSVGVAEQAVAVHQARGVDELLLLDIAATAERRGPDLALIEQLSDACFMPLSVGGGIRSVEDVKALLRAGADKVVIGTALYEDPYLAHRIADSIGRQVLVASVDSKDDTVWTHCGKSLRGARPAPYAEVLEIMGAGEILLTSIDREGSLKGYDLDMVRRISEAVSVPVIAHGGCRDYADMLKALRAGASAVAAGALFQFTDCTPRGAAQYLAEHGLETRV